MRTKTVQFNSLIKLLNILCVKHFPSAAATFTHNGYNFNVFNSLCSVHVWNKFFFKSIHMCYGGDSLRLSRWERARHMARGISLRTPPSGMSCRSPGPRIWLCRGCWTDRTGSRLPAPPAPRTAPEHLTTEQNTDGGGGPLAYVNEVTDGGGLTHTTTCRISRNWV